ncbi:ATP-utilizing protein [Methanolobus halotolerans]|uniref:ATP-utilizing protein n=2 Tax=Methanolobus halotolerans TaxID=2052935 RepID=A0A4E0Q2L6_9EURY|nr:ATP-utilizing protein [Methanolobus halotolerans]
MLGTLVNSFSRLGHEVSYLSSGPLLEKGKAVISCTEDFESVLENEAANCDAGLVIGPDEILADLTEIIDSNTINLGCSPQSVRMCADKLECTRKLQSCLINVPRLITGEHEGLCIIKPRFGCASEGVRISFFNDAAEGYISNEYIKGDHLSVSIIGGKKTLPLSVNKQFIEINSSNENSQVSYHGNMVPYRTSYQSELFDVADATVKALKCNGYVGIDIVHGEKNYVVDVNPRPTTAIFGLARTLKAEIGDLLLKNISGTLPESVEIDGEFSFTKDDFEDIL